MSSSFKPDPAGTTAPALPFQPLLWQETLEHGAHWSGIVRRGTSLRITALQAGANVAALLYNYESLLERYNMADTLKSQHTAYLTAGCVCYSDMGRVLCSITADSCGWHDDGQQPLRPLALPGAAQ